MLGCSITDRGVHIQAKDHPGLAVRAAVARHDAALAALPIGGLFSLVVPLAVCPTLDSRLFHTRWHDPRSDLTLGGAGPSVVPTAQDPACWPLIGPAGSPLPRLFFCRPFVVGDDLAAVCPTVQIIDQGGRCDLVLTARRDQRGLADQVTDWLRVVDRLDEEPPMAQSPLLLGTPNQLPDRRHWLDRVARALSVIADGALHKVVLSRRVDVPLSRPLHVDRLLDSLIGQYPDCSVFSLPTDQGQVVAASPERLLVKRGDHVVSHALAGTCRRAALADDDAALGATLLTDAKERHEHDLVVRMIAHTLGTLCQRVDTPPRPDLLRLRRVQHLWTPIIGYVRGGVGFAQLVAALHPTPAVSGSPRTAALGWLHSLGEDRQGYYTGVAGWFDGHGNGDAAVILRSALLRDRMVSLWAGAGIVARSQPDREWDETELKLSTLLEVLEQA